MIPIRAIAVELPPSVEVRTLVAEEHHVELPSWPIVHRAPTPIHASDLAVRAARKALHKANLAPKDIGAIISCGVSKDYAPSWSLASCAAERLGATHCSLTFDVNAGCAGFLVGIQSMNSELERLRNNKQVGLLLCAEKWNHTVNYKDYQDRGLWGHSDGGGAAVLDPSHPADAFAFVGPIAFAANPEFSELILVDRGGTRESETGYTAKPGRTMDPDTPRKHIAMKYEEKYLEVARACPQGQTADFISMNQIAPYFVDHMAQILGFDKTRTICTGEHHGHVGSVDLLLGMDFIHTQLGGVASGKKMLSICSAPYLFAAASVDFA